MQILTGDTNLAVAMSRSMVRQGRGAGVAWALLCLGVLSPPVGSAAETLVIPGTGDSQFILRKLAAAYMRAHPQDGEIEIPDSIGSSGGIKAVVKGQAVMARVARPLKEKEQTAGLHYREFSSSPIAFVANLPLPCLAGVTGSQLVALFGGQITTWSKLGTCPDHKVYVANREAGDSSRSVIEKNMPGFAAISQPVGETLFSTPETVEVLVRYPYAIGYLPMTTVKNTPLTVLAVDGQPLTEETLSQGKYPYLVPFGLVWRGELTGLADKFYHYLWSDEAAALMTSEGLRPSAARSAP